MKHYWSALRRRRTLKRPLRETDMTPVSQLRGPSREHLAWPSFDSRHSEYARCALLKARPKFGKLIIGRDVLQMA